MDEACSALNGKAPGNEVDDSKFRLSVARGDIYDDSFVSSIDNVIKYFRDDAVMFIDNELLPCPDFEEEPSEAKLR